MQGGNDYFSLRYFEEKIKEEREDDVICLGVEASHLMALMRPRTNSHFPLSPPSALTNRTLLSLVSLPSFCFSF